MKTKRRFYKIAMTLAMLFIASFSFAQLPIKGRVVDEQQQGLSGVTITEKGTSNVTTTGEDGNFTIAVQSENRQIIARYLGKEPVEVTVGNQTLIQITLYDELTSMQEVVVIGYGTQSRETLTTSVSKLDQAVLQNTPYANVAGALQGTLPGVRVQTTSGQPGAVPRVIVRGGTSINNPNGASPLYIVDGIIREDLNNVNSNDIESLQVLKDAASTAIYGARGANGVVLVTTRSGKQGAISVNYGYDMGVSNLRERYALLGARDYIDFQRRGIAARGLSTLGAATSAGTGNDLTENTVYTTQYLTDENKHKLDEGWQSMPDPIDPSKTIIFKDTDFQDVLFNTGYTHNHNLNISGGSETAKFNLGLGYLQNEGIAISTYYERLSLNLNGEVKAADNLTVFGRLSYANRANKNVYGAENNMFGRSLAIPSTTKYTFEDGSLAYGLGASIGNPEYYTATQDVKNNMDNLSLSIGGKWDILPGLSFAPQLSLYQISNDSRTFQQSYFNGPNNFIDSREATANFSRMKQYQADGVFTYDRVFADKHKIEGMAGFSYYQTVNSNIGAVGRGAASDLIPTLNASGEAVSVNGTESELRLIGYFSRINYDYLQRYLLSFNLRYDGASNLGDKKWGFFPGVSAGWNVHNESFWSGMQNTVSQFKLRASYGVNGNIGNLGAYAAQGSYTVGSRYNDEAAIQNNSLVLSNISWEQSKTLNFGADIGLMKGRFNILFDMYRRVTDDLLTTMTLPHSTGFANILTNLGSLENRGVELELSARIFNNSPFSWDVSFNAAKVKNKILQLPENGIEKNRIGGIYVYVPELGDYGWIGGLQQGGTIGDLHAYRQLGIYRTDEEAAAGPTDSLVPLADKTKYGGDVNWDDIDGNGIIDSRDRVNVGNIYPTWTGGFTNAFSYKNIGLLVRMDYTTGHTIYNYTQAAAVGQFQGENGLSTALFRSWTKPGDVTDIPKFYWADQQERSNIFRGNSYYYEKGDYLAIREVTFSYSLPTSILSPLGISQLRLNVTGNNLHYFTKYKGLNPEDGGEDNGRYPIPRTVLFGANLTF